MVKIISQIVCIVPNSCEVAKCSLLRIENRLRKSKGTAQAVVLRAARIGLGPKLWKEEKKYAFGALLFCSPLENGQLIFPSNGDGGVASVLRVTLLGVRKPTTSARFLWLSYSLMFLVVKCTSSTKNDTVFVFGSMSRSRPTTEPV